VDCPEVRRAIVREELLIPTTQSWQMTLKVVRDGYIFAISKQLGQQAARNEANYFYK
jgi:hypothetical protein